MSPIVRVRPPLHGSTLRRSFAHLGAAADGFWLDCPVERLPWYSLDLQRFVQSVGSMIMPSSF